MPPRILAILRAQWRSFWNFRPPGGRGGRVVASILWLVWYGMWAFFASAAGLFAATSGPAALSMGLPWMLMGVFIFWQFAPILTAHAGGSIDLKRILIYPIPESELFTVELLLRLGAAVEMLLVLAGVTIGLMVNPIASRWLAVPAVAVFVAFNAFLAAGLKSLLERLLAIRRVREVVVLVMVLCAALPQLLTYTGLPAGWRDFWQRPGAVLPWAAASRVAAIGFSVVPFLALLGWTAAAYVFGRWQFRRSLHFDAGGASGPSATKTVEAQRGLLHRIPRALFSDPLAAMIEKELVSLSRAPRFRIVFLMGFSFGALIWWPLLHRGVPAPGEVSYPVVVSLYALILLAEVVFWNQFGFDRAAAQLYFSTPIRFADVLLAKNLAALGIILTEVTLVLLVCVVLRVPLPAYRVMETYGVTLVFALYFMAAGNLSSVCHPRPIHPEHSWGRSSSSRFQLYLLLLFPVLLLPVVLAYLAAYAFDFAAAFYLVLAFDAVAGAAVYHAATGSALAAADERKEQFLSLLGQSTGPIVTE